MKIINKVMYCDEGSACCVQLKSCKIEFLYLDLHVCERCQGSDHNLDRAIEIIKPVLSKLGYSLTIHKINVKNESLAKEYKFISSPTIRINDQDIQLDVKEDNCVSCGDLCGDTVDCRVFSYDDKDYHEPPVAMIIDGILKTISNPMHTKELDNYQVPENLLKFYRKTI